MAQISESMHWFNPIILYAFIKMNQDKELLCDEMALNYCNCNKYGHTIIKLLEVYKYSNYIYGLDCIINNKREVERRITMIYQWKQNRFPVEAQKAGIELERIKDKHGGRIPKTIVDESKDKKAGEQK